MTNKGGFIYDELGRIKGWNCPKCGLQIGRSLQNWPESTKHLWSSRREHLKEHEREK